MTGVHVAGVGMTPFVRIGGPVAYPDMVGTAVRAALADAGLEWRQVQRAAVGYVFQPSAAGQRALYDLGPTGIPVVNVSNNCATGSTALMLAREWIQGGQADVALAVGFEQMTRDALSGTASGVSTIDRHLAALGPPPTGGTPLTAWLFAQAAQEHMSTYGTTAADLARVAVKNHGHSTRNPLAQYRRPFTLDEVLADKPVAGPLTRSQCSPMSDGAAAAVLVSERLLGRVAGRPVRIAAQQLVTDEPDAFAGAAIDVVGSGMTRRAARAALAEAGAGIDDVDVVELHDCFSINELLTYEALGMCAPGESAALIRDGATGYGGRWVVNPSGGLISKGHPLGATGLAQCAELVWQLRGTAGDRQVPGCRLGLAHNLGLGGACVVTLYQAGSLN
ncbi:thiolase C-terminal domain-containing protein [Paractinoplanes rishiriensis]|uniref:propanoyl-CoA C-acyltransferase n=1 Tax=Paractinoplanes rishiriensis TaxID=1050105 RepID=A0A919K2U9_9ACTN|nr:beta-ketoacyl synthase N-terminal-like domain-containing protein [Actinoplanes rishiriensis]GIE95621.1 lipid-transfer protein [Actinoplanes rishiriensis]